MSQEQNKKQIIINYEKLETRTAFLNNQRLEEYMVERATGEVLAGSIYLGKIVNLQPSLEAAFVDIGAEKNAFLHYKDMLPASYDMADKVQRADNHDGTIKKLHTKFADKIRNLFGKGEKSKQIAEAETRRRKLKITVSDIPKIFPAGSEILVQVTKGPIGTKGARVTTNLSIPGRYLVLLPYSDHIGLSSKIDDSKERDRLRKILMELDVPEKMGLICRTVGEGRKALYFKRDLDLLLELWQRVETCLQKPKVPSLVYSEPDLLERTVRDVLTEDIDEIVVDNEDAYKRLRALLKTIVGPGKGSEKVFYYAKATPIFEYFKVKEQIADIFKRQVQLPSGGYICIDETEAMIAIDVNTGKAKNKSQPEAILQTNLEAATEVARQLRLRNIGGLVVIDFIDMRHTKDRDAVYKQVRKLVKDDRAKTYVLPISKLGLMEMTRQREQESLKDANLDPCPYCNGSGHVKSVLSMSVEIQRRLQEVLRRANREAISVRVIVHPTVMARLKNEDAGLLLELEQKHGKNLSFRADPDIHLEEFKLVDPETGAEY